MVSYSPKDVSCLYPEAEGKGDALYFNNHEMRDIHRYGTGHWSKGAGGDIALAKGHSDAARGWEYVDAYIEDSDMIAGIQSRGSYMGVAHAILKLTYPPDLIPYINASPEVAVGNPTDIPVEIKNIGLSDARDFEVRFYVDGELKGTKTATVE